MHWLRAGGPQRDFERFVTDSTGQLLRSAYLMTSDLAGAEDLVQETLLRVARRWPRVPDVCPPELEQARAAIDDPEPYVPGSFDDVVLAYDRGWLSDADYDVLSGAAADLPEGLAG